MSRNLFFSFHDVISNMNNYFSSAEIVQICLIEVRKSLIANQSNNNAASLKKIILNERTLTNFQIYEIENFVRQFFEFHFNS